MSPPGSSQLHTNILRFGEEAQRFESAFTAESGVFHAAKRRAQIAQHPAVDPDNAGLNTRRDTVGTREVFGPDGGGQAVFCAVGHLYDFIFRVEGQQRHHRTEDLFLVCPAVGGQSFDDSRLHEPAVGAAAGEFDPVAAAENRSALFPGKHNAGEDFLHVRLGHHRAEIAAGVLWIAHDQFFRSLDKVAFEFLVEGTFNEDSRAAKTNLALIRKGRADRRAEHFFVIAVEKNDVRILTAHFQRQFLEKWSGHL